MTIGVNYYTLLGIPRDSTPEEIRAAYRELARKLHPDTNPDIQAGEAFLAIQKAYEVLIDPSQRVVYDSSLPISFTVNPLKLTTLYSRSALQFSQEPQIIYVLLRLNKTDVDESEPIPPVNLCLVIDCSTSMQGPLMDTVKATAIEIVRQLRPGDIISVVAFSDRANVIVPAGKNQDRSRVETSIRMLQTSGGTEIFQGLEAGFKEAQRFSSDQYINHIVLITDGRTYGDETNCLQLAEKAPRSKITISGLGIGSKWNDIFLDQLTAKTGGSTSFVSRPKDVEKFLIEKYHDLNQSFAEHSRLNYRLEEYVELRDVFRLKPNANPIELANPLLLGAIPRHSSLELLLDILIKPLPKELKELNLLRGRLNFDLPSRPETNQSLRIELSRPTSQGTDPLAPPQAIIQALSHLTLYRIQERARNHVLEGNIKEATRALQHLATHLLTQGERDLAKTVLGEAVHIQQNMAFSEEGDKRIKYGTRALLLPSRIEERSG